MNPRNPMAFPVPNVVVPEMQGAYAIKNPQLSPMAKMPVPAMPIPGAPVAPKVEASLPAPNSVTRTVTPPSPGGHIPIQPQPLPKPVAPPAPTSPMLLGLAASAPSAVAGSFAGQMQNQEFPNISDEQLLLTAEDDPRVAALQSQRLQEIAASRQKPNPLDYGGSMIEYQRAVEDHARRMGTDPRSAAAQIYDMASKKDANTPLSQPVVGPMDQVYGGLMPKLPPMETLSPEQQQARNAIDERVRLNSALASIPEGRGPRGTPMSNREIDALIMDNPIHPGDRPAAYPQPEFMPEQKTSLQRIRENNKKRYGDTSFVENEVINPVRDFYNKVWAGPFATHFPRANVLLNPGEIERQGKIADKLSRLEDKQNVVTPNYDPEDMASRAEMAKSSTSATPPATPSALPALTDAQRMEAQKGVPTTTDSAAIREAARIEEIRKQLAADGFNPLNQLPENQDARSKESYLGPNDIHVRERLGSPQEYRDAVYANQMGAMRGRQVGLPGSGATPYTPNPATLSGMEHGGPITEYAIPGKGTATFMGQRAGGGGFSVVSGASTEDLQKQLAAQRDLRNAYRQAEGRPTVEQEAQMAQIRRMASQFMPDTSGLDAQRAKYQQQLDEAGKIYGPGKGRLRDDRMKAAQIGLAQVEAQQQAANQMAQQGLGFAQQAMQTQAGKEAAQAKVQQEAAQWAAENGLEWRKLSNAEQQAIVDNLVKGSQLRQGDNKNAIDLHNALKPSDKSAVTARDLSNFMTEGLAGKPPTFHHQVWAQIHNIPPAPAPDQVMSPGAPFYTQDGQVMTKNAKGDVVPYPGGWVAAANYSRNAR
jgi:hypothetical protein